MNFMTRFIEAVKGRLHARPREDDDDIPSPFPDKDLAVPLVAGVLSKWQDAIYEGPGAAAADARRRASLGLPEPQEQPVKEKRIRKKREPRPKDEGGGVPRLLSSLLKRRDRLQKEVSLEKRKATK
jgi:hypothetical protein